MFTEEDKAGASILNALFRDAAPAQAPSEDRLTAEQPSGETLAPDAEPETDEPAAELQQPEEPVPEKQTIDLDDLFARRASEDEAEPAVAPALAPNEAALEAPTTNDTETEAQEPVAPEPAMEAPAWKAPAPEKASAGLLELLKPSETAARLPPTLLDRAEFVQQLVVLLCVRQQRLIYRRIRRTWINCTPTTALGTAYSTKYLVHHATLRARVWGIVRRGRAKMQILLDAHQALAHDHEQGPNLA